VFGVIYFVIILLLEYRMGAKLIARR